MHRPITLVLLLALLFNGCATFKAKPPPAPPSSVTQKATESLVGSLDLRLSAISAWLAEAMPVAASSDRAPKLVPILAPAAALAGPADPKTAKEIHGIAAEVLKGNLVPAQDAAAKAEVTVDNTSVLRANLSASAGKDQATLTAYMKAHDADWQKKLDKANSFVWNLISGLLITVGVLGVAAGFAVRYMALQIPFLGPKIASAVSLIGGVLFAGGICLYAIGPYLHILAIALGIAAVLGLIAGALASANHHHLCSPSLSPQGASPSVSSPGLPSGSAFSSTAPSAAVGAS